jgi:hypothetical protein
LCCTKLGQMMMVTRIALAQNAGDHFT